MALWGNKDNKTATGTVSIADTGVVTGSSTLFTTEAKVGNTITVDGVDYLIITITSNTVAKVVMGANNGNGTVTTASAASYTLSEKPAFVARESISANAGNSNIVYGVDGTEKSTGGDNVVSVAIANAGSRYKNTPTVTFSGGGGSSAAATATQAGAVITAVTVTNVGSAYTSAPTVAIAKPRRNLATTSVSTTVDTFTFSAHTLVINEAVKYFNGGGASATGLVDGTTYYVATAGFISSAFEVKAAATSGTLVATVAASGTAGEFTCGASTLAVGDRVTIAGTNTGTATGVTAGTYKVSAVTGTSPSVTGFTLTTEAAVALVTTAGTLVGLTYTTETVVDVSGTGNNAQYFEIQATADAATAVAALGSGAGGTQITHAGWVRRTVGTGGRAGRIQYETLVAMGSISSDAADDLVLPDA